MHRIDGAGHDNNTFTEGDPQSAVPATVVTAAFLNAVQEEFANLVEHDGGVLDKNDNTQVLTKILALIAAAQQSVLYMHVQDQKPNGVSGGTSVAGPQARVLNTVLTNTIPGAVLASNQITLPAGTYRIRARAPVGPVDGNVTYWQNVTDGVTVIVGSASNGLSNLSSHSFLEGRFTIAATKVFELGHDIVSSIANGLGYPGNRGYNEIYASVEIIKES